MRGSIVKRCKNSYSIIYDGPRGADGKRKQIWVSVKGTKRDAEKQLTELVNSVNRGEHVSPSQETVAIFLERWLRDSVTPNVAASTLSRYGIIVRSHLIKEFGELKLRELSASDIQKYYAKAQREGLSARTALHHHRVLKMALKAAVDQDQIARNPADRVTAPRPSDTEFEVLDEAQTARMLSALEGDHMCLPALLAATTGLRRGELLAVRWSDVDLDRAVLSVRQTISVTGEGIEFRKPKTKRSRRQISLPALAVSALRLHKTEQAKRRLALGRIYQNHDLVVCRDDGQPIDPRGFSKAFRAALKRRELPLIRFHDLRHGHASILLKQGIHPKVVSDRLGHSSVAITMDVYSHVLPGLEEDAMLKLDRALRVAINDQNKNV